MTTSIDPVCGMTVIAEQAADAAEHGGQKYHFCSRGCAGRFRSNPERYLAGGSEPMHLVPGPDEPAQLHTIGGPQVEDAR